MIRSHMINLLPEVQHLEHIIKTSTIHSPQDANISSTTVYLLFNATYAWLKLVDFEMSGNWVRAFLFCSHPFVADRDRLPQTKTTHPNSQDYR